MACNKCDKVVNDSDLITCRGYCGNSFHMICMKLDYSVREVLNANEKNMFWLCDSCSELFSNDQFRKISSRHINDMPEDTPLKSIKDDIAGLKQIVSALSSKIDAKPLTPVFNSWGKMDGIQTIPNTPKRIREDVQSTIKPSIIRGSKAASEMVKTVRPPEDLFWLYLSAFEPSTSDSEIVAFVKECMSSTEVDPKVVRLVAKNKDPSTLSFVTFKVGVPKTLKDVALSSETWPDNIYFREFDNNSKNQRRLVRITAERSPIVVT